MTRRILLTVSYEGTAYGGWQKQLNADSVQAQLEKALYTAEKKPVCVIGASRTDAGVHALAQRAHFDTDSRIPAEKYPFVFNTLLPGDIRVKDAKEVPHDLHARFSALGKTYTYRIDNARQACALKQRFYAHVPLLLNEQRMQEAAQLLLGEHDFLAFSASGGQAKTSVRTLHRLDVVRTGEDVTLYVAGNGFLYNMVRIIAGTLIAIGQGKLEADAIERALQTGDRRLLGMTAPAKGLELTRVYYEGEA